MKDFKILDNTYQICESWSELTLKQYILLAELGLQEENKLKEEELINKLVNIPGTDIPFSPYSAQILSYLSDIPEDEFGKIEITEYLNLLPTIQTFLKSEPANVKMDEFDIGGIHYKLEKLTDLSTGAMFTINDYRIRNEGKTDIALCCAVLYRPSVLKFNREKGIEEWIIEPFDTENLEHRKELFLKMKANVFVGAISFFLFGKEILTSFMNVSTLKKLRKGKLKISDVVNSTINGL